MPPDPDRFAAMRRGQKRGASRGKRKGWEALLQPLQPWLQSRWIAYTIPFISVAIAALLEVASTVRPAIDPFLFFFPAVALTAWLTGHAPGMIAVALAALAGNWAFLEPLADWSLSTSSLAATSLFILSAAVVGLLCATVRDAMIRLQNLAAEHRQTVASLRRKESILTQAGEMAHLGAWDVDLVPAAPLDSTSATWSDETYRIFGYAPGSIPITGQTFFERVHPADRQAVRDIITQSISERRPHGIEMRIVRPNGVERIVKGHAEIVCDERGVPTRMVGFAQDVTELKRSERALQVSEERLRLVTEIAEVGVYDFYPMRGDAVGNMPLRRAFGWTAEESVSLEKGLGRVHPEDRAHVKELLERGLDPRSSGEISAEFRTVWPDGSVHWVTGRGHVYFDESQGERRAVRMIGSILDITERKRTEQALREGEQRLRDAEEVVRIASELTGFDTFDYRPQTGEVCIPEQTRYRWGFPADGRLCYRMYLDKVHPDDRERVHASVQATLRSETHGEYAIEHRVRSNGEERWLQVRGRVFQDERGQPVRLVGGAVDITERRRMDELRERLFGIVGHDLRSPLSSIRMAAEVLRASLPPEHTRNAEIIARSAVRMNRMIGQLLDFTRVRFAAGVELETNLCDLAQLCREVVLEIQLAHPGRNILCQIPDSCWGTWDRDRLGQVISNLVENALQHGSTDRPIQLRVRDAKEHVQLEVHNWGPPIPAEVLPQIYDPFRRISPEERVASGGLGLGLYISREIVAAHGGDLEVQSTSEKGTTFRARLPRSPARADHSRHERQTKR